MLIENTSKICSLCFIDKPLPLFSPNTKGKYGRAQVCKLCSAKRATENRNPIKEASRKYKISEENVLELKSRTSCEICGNKNRLGKALCIDHCHTTGKIRGVLCDDCNTGIGKLKDDPKLLQNAINYLKTNG